MTRRDSEPPSVVRALFFGSSLSVAWGNRCTIVGWVVGSASGRPMPPRSTCAVGVLLISPCAPRHGAAFNAVQLQICDQWTSRAHCVIHCATTSRAQTFENRRDFRSKPDNSLARIAPLIPLNSCLLNSPHRSR
eukprot:3915660-Rhodomonas_salina.2